MTDSINTPAEDEDEFFDGAQSGFPEMEDLDNRLVAIWANENGVGKGDSGPYPYVETDTMILDDGLDGTAFTEKVEAVGDTPAVITFRHSTTGLATRLKPRVGRTDKPMIGRINSRPSTKYKKGSPAFSIAEPTEDDMAIARKHKAVIMAFTAERKARLQKDEDTEAFG